MTISSSTNRISYVGSGSTGPFAVPYYFLEDNDLKVVKKTIADGAEVTLALATDYTVSGAGVPAGGSITLVTALAATHSVSIVRDPDALQATAYPTADKFPAASHERALDKLTMLMQRALDYLSRSVKLSDGDTSGADLTLPAPAASSFFGWNAAGTALVNYIIQVGTTLAELSSGIHAAVSKATPVDADEFAIVDSAASNVLKKVTWGNIKATLKTHFDALYAALAGSASQDFAAKHVSATLGVGIGGATAGAGGIAFPAVAVAVADANTLDDYEEGTWTPIDNSGAGLSFTGVEATYEKIGRQFRAGFTVTYPVTANGASAEIAGLPFTVANTEAARQGFLTYSTEATMRYLSPLKNTTRILQYAAGPASITNATLSGDVIVGTILSHV